MKKIVLSLLILGVFLMLKPAFAVPPPPPPMYHGEIIRTGHHMPPPPHRINNRIHGGVSFNMNPVYSYRYTNYYGLNRYSCPCYGVCRPFRHPGPQYSTGFYISF